MQIKKVIDDHKETWASIAKKTGKTSSAIIQIADGNPTVGKLKYLASVIGCHWLDFFADELEEEGLMIVPRQIQQPAPQPAAESASAEQQQAVSGEGGASDLPFGCGEPSAIGQQAIVCPHCHQALVMNIASYEQK